MKSYNLMHHRFMSAFYGLVECCTVQQSTTELQTTGYLLTTALLLAHTNVEYTN